MTHNNMQVCAHISPSWSSPPHHWPAKVICSFPISLYPLLPLLYFSLRNLPTLEIILFICCLHCWNVNSNEMSSGRYLVHCYTPEPGIVIWHIVDTQWFFFLNELIFLNFECMKLVKDKETFFTFLEYGQSRSDFATECLNGFKRFFQKSKPMIDWPAVKDDNFRGQ